MRHFFPFTVIPLPPSFPRSCRSTLVRHRSSRKRKEGRMRSRLTGEKIDAKCRAVSARVSIKMRLMLASGTRAGNLRIGGCWLEKLLLDSSDYRREKVSFKLAFLLRPSSIREIIELSSKFGKLIILTNSFLSTISKRKKIEEFSPPFETPLINSNSREGEFYPIFRGENRLPRKGW